MRKLIKQNSNVSLVFPKRVIIKKTLRRLYVKIECWKNLLI